jgi:hypothetical protein
MGVPDLTLRTFRGILSLGKKEQYGTTEYASEPVSAGLLAGYFVS